MQELSRTFCRGFLPLIRSARFYKHIPKPQTFENVIFPEGDYKLPFVNKEPPPLITDKGKEKQFKETKKILEARMPEAIHTELWHKQYGIQAETGGFMKIEHFNLVRQYVNKKLRRYHFAIWRIEQPWLPKAFQRGGRKRGGGKAKIHHYVTPVRPGRIVLELGGYITELEAQAILSHMAMKVPFAARFVTYEEMEEEKAEAERIESLNTNEFDWDRVLQWNMQNCTGFLSPYNIAWRDKMKF